MVREWPPYSPKARTLTAIDSLGRTLGFCARPTARNDCLASADEQKAEVWRHGPDGFRIIC